jgi:hypothetical protein
MSSRLLWENIKITTYKSIILPVVLYGLETWSLTLRKEHRLKVFEIRVVRRIYWLVVGKPGRKGPLGRPRRRWVDNIEMDLVEIGWGDVNGIGVAQGKNKKRAVVNVTMDLRVP